MRSHVSWAEGIALPLVNVLCLCPFCHSQYTFCRFEQQRGLLYLSKGPRYSYLQVLPVPLAHSAAASEVIQALQASVRFSNSIFIWLQRPQSASSPYGYGLRRDNQLCAWAPLALSHPRSGAMRFYLMVLGSDRTAIISTAREAQHRDVCRPAPCCALPFRHLRTSKESPENTSLSELAHDVQL